MMEGHVEPAPASVVEEVWRDQWGIPIVSVERCYMPMDVEALAWRDTANQLQGLITWAVDGDSAEIVTVDAFVQGAHIGGRLLGAVEGELAKRGVRRVMIITTNDNLRAFNFYVRHGYRLVRIHLDGMDRVRAQKAGVPDVGSEGIALRDMWELRKELDGDPATTRSP